MFDENDVSDFPFLKKSTVSRYIDSFEPWYALWPKFDAASRAVLRSPRYKYMVISDISGYYENIQLSILRSLLNRYQPSSPRTINLLIRHLKAWQTFTHDGLQVDRGIPQGNSISSFLGNFYLKPVDDFFDTTFDRKDAIYFRYMDDIRIVAKDHLTATRAALALESQIRKSKLNLQTAKTSILPSSDALRLISDNRLSLLDAVRPLVASNKAAAVVSLDAIAKNKGDSKGALRIHGSRAPFSDLNLRVLRRWASYHEQLGRRTGVNRIAREALANPAYKVTRDFQRIARRFPHLIGEPARMWDALAKDEIAFPYQRAEMLAALRKFSWFPPTAFTMCENWCGDTTVDPYVRLQAALFLCRHAGHWPSAKALFDTCIVSPDLRVVLAGMVVASAADRASMLDAMNAAYSHAAAEATQFVQYVRSIRHEDAPRRALLSFVLPSNEPAEHLLYDYAVFLRFISSGSHKAANDLYNACTKAASKKRVSSQYKMLLNHLAAASVRTMIGTPSPSGAIV
ncbi:RNA-directed DNA polymerase [Brevundimonas sp. LjRoot202]|uniref:RNA-directed DNA polymerase n=1 Tax=Brevundimonas sp. LjRoot202 TaxID=3342281 RepID=UPI003ECE0A2A